MSSFKCFTCGKWVKNDETDHGCSIIRSPFENASSEQIDDNLTEEDYYEDDYIYEGEESSNTDHPYVLQPPSDEQKIILDKVKQGLNITISAVAGSGKTTTSLLIAQENKNKSILLLTYNAKLKAETRQKRNQLGFKHMEVHNYHAFGVLFYPGLGCHTDEGLKKALLKPRTDFNYGIIIIDEAQDLTPTFFLFANHICNEKTQLVIMGDKKQNIYEFNLSWSEYLTRANEIFIKNKNPWVNLTLSVSFRLTHPMATFINEVFLQKNVIKGFKDGIQPEILLFKSRTDRNHMLSKIITDLLNNPDSGIKPDDILILAPSVKSKDPSDQEFYKPGVSYLTNELSSKHNIKIYTPRSDHESQNSKEALMKGKICCLSFHQSKGIERKIVFVFNVDTSYFKFYSKNSSRAKLPNTLYVALTRASEKLYLVSFSEEVQDPSRTFDFVNINKITPYIRTEYMENIFSEANEKTISYTRTETQKDTAKKTHDGIVYRYLDINKPIILKQEKIVYKVTYLLENISVDDINYCFNLLTINNIHLASEMIELESQISTVHGQFEEVSDINGTAIPLYYSYLKNNKQFPDLVIENTKKLEMKHSISDVLTVANEYNCKMSGYDHKFNQIKKYEWMSQMTMKACLDRLENYVGKNSQDEVKVGCQITDDTFVVGAIDCICEDTIWEFKCTTSLKKQYYLQLAMYAYLHMQSKEIKDISSFCYKLFNIKTEQIDEIKVSEENALKIIKHLIDLKSKDWTIEAKQKFNNVLLNISKQ